MGKIAILNATFLRQYEEFNLEILPENAIKGKRKVEVLNFSKITKPRY